MAFLKVALFVAFACFANAIPQLRKLDQEDGWQQTATILSHTSVLDGSLKQIAYVNITIATYNFTQDSYQQVADTVRRNLANIQVDSEAPHDSLRVYEGENAKLPLAMNFTMTEVVSSQAPPHALRAFGIKFHVDVYAKKKHRSDVLGALKNFSI